MTENTATRCARCGGSSIDPEDSHTGTYEDGTVLEPPAEEPCRDCVHPPSTGDYVARLLTDAHLRTRIQRAIRARLGTDLDISAWIAEDVMDVVTPAMEDQLADGERRLREELEARDAERAEEITRLQTLADRESALVSEARHERDTARKEAREARREAARLITGDRSDVLHWAVRQLRAAPMPTALTGPYWYGQGWQEAINYLEYDLAGAPTDAQVELVEQAEEIGRLRAQLAATTRPGTDTEETDR